MQRKSMGKRWKLVGLAGALILTGCGDADSPPAGQEGWMVGDQDQKFDTIAKHIRGLDVAMMEIDHRYGELYWAGEDQNWDYAAYQLRKMELALNNAIERRPKRAASSQLFLDTLPTVRTAIDARDGARFDEAFVRLTGSCNACHAAENMAFIQVRTPVTRFSHAYGPGAPEASD